MAFNLKKFLDDAGRTVGKTADAIVPGNQSQWHRPAPTQRQPARLPAQLSANNQPQLRVRQAPAQNVSVARPRPNPRVTVATPTPQLTARVDSPVMPKPQPAPQFNLDKGLEALARAPGEFNEGVGQMVTAIRQAPFRAVRSLGNDIRGQKTYKPEGTAQRYLYGEAPVTNSEGTGRDTLGIVGVKNQSPLINRAAGTAINVLDATPISGAALKAGIKAAPLAKAATKQTAKTAVAVNKAVEQVNPRVKEIDEVTRPTMQRAYDIESNPQVKAEIGRGLTRLNMERQSLSQGGYAKIPGKEPTVATPVAQPHPGQAGDTPQPMPTAAVEPLQLPDKKLAKVATQTSSYINSTPELPTINTKKVSNIDKAFRSTRSVIERQGDSGKELASKLQGARDIEELYQADLLKQMPTVTKLKGKEFENFVDATQGKESPISPKVTQAVGEWQAIHPQIRQRAVSAGLDVGDLGPNYYPHFIDYDRVFGDKNTYNEAINHLVKSGQAPDQAEAIKLLGYARDTSRNRTFGNLEASRQIDLPFYDKTNNSFRQYIQSATKRIANTETFGAKDEEALKLITKAGSEGFDTEAMKNAYDIAVGARKYNQATEKASRNIRRYTTTTRLGLGALTNVSQSVNTGIVAGHFRTMGAMLKQLDPKVRAYVEDTGTISDAVLNDIRSQQGFESFGKSAFGKTVNAVTAPGFGAVEKFNRSVAATAGRDYALRLAQKGDQATLRKLGVTGAIKNKTLSGTQQIEASRKIVEKTQFKVDPQDLPGWVDSPGGKLVAQFRTFSYNQSKFFSNEVIKPGMRGDLMPLARVLAALPVGYGLYETRRAVDGRPEEEDKTKVALQSFGKIGGAGLVLDIYNGLNPVGSKYIPSDRRTSMAVGTLGGPSIGTAANLVGAVSEAVQKKNIPKTNPDLEGKVAVRSGQDDKEGYNDLTSISRFGLQQIPVVGSPAANRVIPYKKQSEADSGKKTDESPDLVTQLLSRVFSPDKAGASDGSLSAVEKIQAESDKRLTDLKDSLSDEDYQIMQLSETDRKKLVDSGAFTASKIKGLEDYYDKKKADLGYEVKDSTKKLPDSLKSRKDVQNIYRELDKMSSEETKEWRRGTANGNSQDLIKQANTILPPDFPGLPSNNGVAESYVDFLKRSQEGEWSEIQKQKEMGKFVKEAYETQFNDDEKFVRDLADADLLDAVDNGQVEKSVLDKIIAMDDILVELGMDAKVGKKARAALGYHAQPTTVRGTGKATKAASRAKGKGRRFTIPTTDVGNTAASSTYKTLQSLLAGTEKSVTPQSLGRKVALKKIQVKGKA